MRVHLVKLLSSDFFTVLKNKAFLHRLVNVILPFSYTTCEWSESEFHNKVLFCSGLLSDSYM